MSARSGGGWGAAWGLSLMGLLITIMPMNPAHAGGLKVGDPAPEFTLPDQDGEQRSLSDYRGGWLVLYFYPKDDTPGCTVEAQEFTALHDAFEEAGAVVLGVSPDPVERHARFRDKYGLRVRLLADPDHRVMEAYGAWGEKTLYGRKSVGVIRSTVLVDPEGRIAAHWPRVRAKGHAKAVLDELKSLREAA